MASNVGFFLDDEVVQQIVNLQTRYAVVEKPPLDRPQFTKSEIMRRAMEAGIAKLEDDCAQAESQAEVG
jgi:hypothetical protein